MTYVVQREDVRRDARSPLGCITEGLFAFLARNALVPTDAYRIPPQQVIEFGLRVDV